MLKLQQETADQENLFQTERVSEKSVSLIEELDQKIEKTCTELTRPMKRTRSSFTSQYEFEIGLDMIQYPHEFQDQTSPNHKSEMERHKFQKFG
jgi:hypothetical protein